jgi:hypothetical protein
MGAGATIPLKIALLGISERDKAMLDLFLRKHCPGGCRVVSEERADICILDLDGIHGKKLLQQQRDSHSQRPLIVLSVRDTHVDGVQFLRKPLRTELLKHAIEFCRNELAQRAPAPAPAPEILTPTPAQSANSDGAKAKRTPVGFAGSNTRGTLRSQEKQKRFVHEWCGQSSAIDLSKKVDNDKLYYDPSTLFQSILKHAVDRCRHEERAVRLHLPGGKHITLLPKAGLALTDLSDARLRPRCLLAIKHDETRIEYPRYSETHLLRTSNQSPQNIDALLWKVTLWSARGRLPLGTDINSAVGLQHWPNLTRLMTIPQFLRVSALWVTNPLTLAKTVETLGVEARYVCAFFSACHALELTQIQATTASPEVPVVSLAKSSRPGLPGPSRPGLLGRILRRLRVA